MAPFSGISVRAFQSLISGGQYFGVLNDVMSGYTHSIRAFGGFWDARIELAIPVAAAEEWYENGLDRHIIVTDEAAQTVWEGFVDSISIQVGGLTAVRGPVLGISNRARLVYSVVDTTTSPPTMGSRAISADFNDTVSQVKWGLLIKVLSTGGIAENQVTSICQTYLDENKQPESSEQLTFGGNPANAKVVLSCMGYVHRLTRGYFETTSTGTTTASARIALIITGEPNGLFPTTTPNIQTNSLSIPAYEVNQRTRWDIIKGIVAQGDSSGNRYTFGIYQNRQPYYAPAPTDYTYRHYLADNAQIISDYNVPTLRIQPWSVRPGNWLFVSDFMSGRVQNAELLLDPRAIFIESVSYTMPHSLTLDGGKTSTLKQKLAQLGLSGIGA